MIGSEILNSMARAFFAEAYAQQADECGEPLRGEIMDQLPEVMDPSALHAADTLARDLINAHWQGEKKPDSIFQGLRVLFSRAQFAYDEQGADRELTPELFGHYLAMQAMGTGVGLESFGDAVRDCISVPYVEFSSAGLSRDYFEPVGE